MQITNHVFKHTRSKATMDRWEHLKGKEDEEFDGELMIIGAVFGIDIYIQLFDGENRFFISGTGGHSSNVVMLQMEVDSKQKVIFATNNLIKDDLKHTVTEEDFYKSLHENLSYHLPKEVYALIKTYFQKGG